MASLVSGRSQPQFSFCEVTSLPFCSPDGTSLALLVISVVGNGLFCGTVGSYALSSAHSSLDTQNQMTSNMEITTTMEHKGVWDACGSLWGSFQKCVEHGTLVPWAGGARTGVTWAPLGGSRHGQGPWPVFPQWPPTGWLLTP